VADNLAAVAATLEAMRAIERHGGAAILERAFTGFIALPAPIAAGMKREWWVVLDCSPNSGREIIEHSFKRLASRYHPDKEGGSAAKMAELNGARAEALEAVS
jgi:predicted metal-dependent phosphoesterase TrpH